MDMLNNYGKQAHWALRVALAAVFIYHGVDKLLNAGMMAQMMGMPTIMIIVLGLMETAAGALVFAGGFLQDWMTRLGALLIIPIMLGAIAMVHWGQWAFAASDTHPMGGMEFQVTLILVSVYLLIKGNTVSA